MSAYVKSAAAIPSLMRFLIVGGAFAAGYAVVTAILTGPLGAPVFATSLCIYLLCIPMAFTAQKKIAFRAKEARKSGFAIYTAMQFASFVAVSYVSTRYISGNIMSDTLIFLATAGGAAVLSFVILRGFAFKPGA